MNEQSRTRKSLKNSVVALIFYSFTLLLNFFSRKIFLNYLGTEILGLNSTAQNLLQFLNLAELGIGAAVGFSLYKPLHDKNYLTINEIITLQGHIYKRIAIIIICCSFVLMMFFPLIFKKISLPLWYAYASFGVFLFSSLLSYFFNYKQIILSASQNDYKIQYSYRSILLIKVVFQMWVVYALPDGFIWWLICEVVFAIIASISLRIVTNKAFPNLKSVDESFKILRKKHSIIVTKVKQLFFHRIAGFALTQTAPLIIYALIDLDMVAIYVNYTIITVGINSLMTSIFNSLSAGVGNLIAEGNSNKIIGVFEELFCIRFILSSSLCFVVFALGSSFIKLWIGNEFVLPTLTLLLITIQLFIGLTRNVIETYVYAYGLYGDIFAPIIETFLNISLSVLFGYLWGLNGILLGVICSLIIIPVIWRPYYLFKNKLKGFGKKYFKLYVTYLIIALILSIIIYFIYSNLYIVSINNYFQFFLNAAILFILYLMIFILIVYPFSKGMRDGIRRLKMQIIRIKNS